MGTKSGYRARLFRAVHAEAVKRGIDHDALHDLCRGRYGVRSMSDLTEHQLLGLYRDWTGKTLRNRMKPARRGEVPDVQLVSGEELAALEQEFAKRNWGPDTVSNFVRRQLRGRTTIRTHADWRRVFHGVRAMNRREAL